MPWPVYTERLMQVSETNVWRHYTVKQGQRLILKSIVAVYSGTGAGMKVHVVLNDFYVGAFPILVPYESTTKDLLAVAYEGEQLRVFLEGTSGFFVATGWVMADPVGAPLDADVLPAPPGAGDWPAPDPPWPPAVADALAR